MAEVKENILSEVETAKMTLNLNGAREACTLTIFNNPTTRLSE